MVTDGTRLPAPSPTRSRLARSTTASRIPAPRRTSRTPAGSGTPCTPRREAVMLTPRRESAIPTPRRSPRIPSEPKESAIPSLRRVSRSTAVTPKYSVDKQDAPSPVPSSFRTPRRSSVRAPVARVSEPVPSESPRPSTASRLAAPKTTYRRQSTANDENRTLSRLAAPKSAHRRLSSSNGQNNASRVRPAGRQDERAVLPDRGTNSIGQPSPAASTRRVAGSGVPRVALKASPYARRSSHGGGTGVRAAANVSAVSRKLNMAPGLDAEDEDVPTQSRVPASPVPNSRRLSSSTRLDAALRTGAVDRQYKFDRPDRSEKRRDSGAGKGRAGVTALESFRAARRASLESAEQEMADTENNPHSDPLPEAVPAKTPSKGIAVEIENTNLPDRPDPVTPSAKMTPRRNQANPLRRASHRFSDADVCLENVDRLRNSLGRRRSHGVKEPGDAPQTPVLRRTSLGKGDGDTSARDDTSSDSFDSALGDNKGLGDVSLRQRAPLRSIETNTDGCIVKKRSASPRASWKQNSGLSAQKATPSVPKLDDDDLGWDQEEVEDLGAW